MLHDKYNKTQFLFLFLPYKTIAIKLNKVVLDYVNKELIKVR
jgi:hypothetical protein